MTPNKKIYRVFKEYLVKRKGGNCGIWVGIAELDDLVAKLIRAMK